MSIIKEANTTPPITPDASQDDTKSYPKDAHHSEIAVRLEAQLTSLRIAYDRLNSERKKLFQSTLRSISASNAMDYIANDKSILEGLQELRSFQMIYMHALNTAIDALNSSEKNEELYLPRFEPNFK